MIVQSISFGKFRVRYSLHRDKKIAGYSIPLKNYKQRDPYSCAFVAAFAVARKFKPDIDAVKVLRAVRPDVNCGVNQTGLTNALESLGIKAEFRKDLTVAKIRKCVKQGMPIIVSVWPRGWHTDHWTVIQGFGSGRVYLVNHQSLGVERFLKQWSDMDMRGRGGSREGIICRQS